MKEGRAAISAAAAARLSNTSPGRGGGALFVRLPERV
jgi:hypothetical protein